MTSPHDPSGRAALRQRLLAQRQTWIDTPAAAPAQAALSERLLAVLAQLEPDCLGVYWPMKGEFNPQDAALAAQQAWGCHLALPFAEREPVSMHYRAWDGAPPTGRDGCGLPAPAQDKRVQPDVLLVPCVGFTPEGFRLGYGGGFFDRYLAEHPGVTALGLAWEGGQLDVATLAPQSHDIALMAVLTEAQTWG